MKDLLSRSIFVALMIAPVLFAPCANAAESKFRIVISSPLTGALAEYGVATKNGVTLAQEENVELFKGIEFVFEDSGYDPKQALTIYQRHTKTSPVNLIYNWGSNPSGSIVPVAERECFPLVVVDFSQSMTLGKKLRDQFCKFRNRFFQSFS